MGKHYNRGEAGEKNKPHPSLKKVAKSGGTSHKYNRAKVGDKNKPHPTLKRGGKTKDLGSEYAG